MFKPIIKKKHKQIGIAFALSFKIFAFLTVIFWPSKALPASITEKDLFDLTNYERTLRQIPELIYSNTLEQSAQGKAADMLDKDYFAHYSPSGISPWYWFEKYGYKYQYAGENIAKFGLSSREIHEAWMNSPTHKENILNTNFSQMGVGIVRGKDRGTVTTVVVTHFGTPKLTTGGIMDAKQIKSNFIKKINFWRNPANLGPIDVLYLLFIVLMAVSIVVTLYKKSHQQIVAAHEMRNKTLLLFVLTALFLLF